MMSNSIRRVGPKVQKWRQLVLNWKDLHAARVETISLWEQKEKFLLSFELTEIVSVKSLTLRLLNYLLT